VTEEIPIRQSATEATSAVPSGEQGITGGARGGAERETPEINRYLYENLISNLEGQIDHWNRKAARQPDPETAQSLRTKAEGLGYALRLLAAFEPEFRELTDAAIRFGSKGST
jgi:hypothetical protein